jgi:putative flippase GtrA
MAYAAFRRMREDPAPNEAHSLPYFPHAPMKACRNWRHVASDPGTGMFLRTSTMMLTRRLPAGQDRARFARFTLVGVTYSLIYSAFTAVLVSIAGAPAFVTSTMVYALCIPLAYLTQKSFTFRAERVQRAGFVLYAATQVSCMAIVSLITTQLISGHVVQDTALFLATAGVTALASYWAMRCAVFRSAE